MKNDIVDSVAFQPLQSVCCVLVPAKGDKDKTSVFAILVLGDGDIHDATKGHCEVSELNLVGAGSNVDKELFRILVLMSASGRRSHA